MCRKTQNQNTHNFQANKEEIHQLSDTKKFELREKDKNNIQIA